MQILLTARIIERLRRELKKAGLREIGGLVMGEHVRDEIFRVADISVQRSGGSQGHFVRDPSQHQTQLNQFFAETGHDYTRFNYLGEWHSHPSFEPLPSDVDARTMQSIVEDPTVGANFLVLMIPRLTRWGRLRLSATLFRPQTLPRFVSIALEHAEKDAFEGIWGTFVRRITGW